MFRPEGKRKLIHVDSQDMISGTLQSFNVQLSESLKDVVSLSLQTVELSGVTNSGPPDYLFLELSNLNANALVASNTNDTRYFAKIPYDLGTTSYFYTVNDTFENIRFTDPQSFNYMSVALYTYNRATATPSGTSWSFTLLAELKGCDQKSDPFKVMY
jgi:hypothetical protein